MVWVQRFLMGLRVQGSRVWCGAKNVKALLLEIGCLSYRHPDRSGGIFLAGGDNVVCVIAENGNPSAKGARKSRVRGRFLAALEMTVSGDREVQET